MKIKYTNITRELNETEAKSINKRWDSFTRKYPTDAEVTFKAINNKITTSIVCSNGLRAVSDVGETLCDTFSDAVEKLERQSEKLKSKNEKQR